MCVHHEKTRPPRKKKKGIREHTLVDCNRERTGQAVLFEVGGAPRRRNFLSSGRFGMHVYPSGQIGAHGCEWKETREAHQRMLLFFLPLPSPDSRGKRSPSPWGRNTCCGWCTVTTQIHGGLRNGKFCLLHKSFIVEVLKINNLKQNGSRMRTSMHTEGLIGLGTRAFPWHRRVCR